MIHGTGVDTIRRHCERLVDAWNGPATLVRINLDESDVSKLLLKRRRKHVHMIELGLARSRRSN